MITYHPLYVEDRCTLVNLPSRRNGARWELGCEGPLEFPHVVIHIAINCSHLHQLGGINLSKSFDINRSPLLIYPVMTLGIVFQDFI